MKSARPGSQCLVALARQQQPKSGDLSVRPTSQDAEQEHLAIIIAVTFSARRLGCRRILLAICRLFLRGLRLGLAGGLLGFVVRLLSSLSCFFARAIDGFLCLSGYGLAGFLRFLAYGF